MRTFRKESGRIYRCHGAMVNEEWAAVPNWPRGHRRRVRALWIAWRMPRHVGMFREDAFPIWWQKIRRYKRKRRTPVGFGSFNK